MSIHALLVGLFKGDVNLSNSKIVLKNIGFGILFKPISILLSFIITPITISLLGNSIYGLWATILSIISWISFFDVGIGNGLRNHLSTAISKKDYDSAKQYIATGYIVIIFISIFLIGILTLFAYFFDWKAILNTNLYSRKELSIVLVINFIFISINFVLKLVTTIFYSLQKSFISSIIQISHQALVLFGVLYLTNNGYTKDLVAISIVYGLASICVNMIFTLILFITNAELRFKCSDFKKSKIRELSDLGVRFFIIQIAAMIIFTTDNLIISNLFGPEEVTPYNITYKLFSVITIIHTIIITPIWSAVTKANSENNKNWIRLVIKKQNHLQLLIIIASLVLVMFFHRIVGIWLGGNTVNISFFLVISYAFYTVLSTWCNSYSYIMNGLGLVNFQLVIAIIQGVVNIPLSILFAYNFKLGITGVILGTNITLLIAAILYPLYLKRKITEIN